MEALRRTEARHRRSGQYAAGGVRRRFARIVARMPDRRHLCVCPRAFVRIGPDAACDAVIVIDLADGRILGRIAGQ